MENKAKTIKKIQVIANTVLANGCYHTKEMENQIMMAEKLGKINENEKTIICKAWELRSKLAHDLMQELGAFIDDQTKND